MRKESVTFENTIWNISQVRWANSDTLLRLHLWIIYFPGQYQLGKGVDPGKQSQMHQFQHNLRLCQSMCLFSYSFCLYPSAFDRGLCVKDLYVSLASHLVRNHFCKVLSGSLHYLSFNYSRRLIYIVHIVGFTLLACAITPQPWQEIHSRPPKRFSFHFPNAAGTCVPFLLWEPW